MDQVLNLYLQVYAPLSYQGAQDVDQLATMWLAYVPTDMVNDLAAQIKVRTSKFYTGSTGIAQSLALRVDSSFAINSVQDPNSSTDGTTSGSSSGSNSSASSTSKTRQDAIIGVVSALGAIALAILGLLLFRGWKRRQELAHRRLSDPTDMAGARPYGQEFDRDSLGGQRRRSFYYAEDSLSGGQGGGSEERYDYHSPDAGMRERRAIVPGTISTPYLQQSSMNW